MLERRENQGRNVGCGTGFEKIGSQKVDSNCRREVITGEQQKRKPKPTKGFKNV